MTIAELYEIMCELEEEAYVSRSQGGEEIIPEIIEEESDE